MDSQHQPTAYSQRYFMESGDLVLKLSALSISIRAEILMGLAVLNDSFKDGLSSGVYVNLSADLFVG